MNKSEYAIVKGIILNRKNLIEIVVVTILLAFGVNLLAGRVLALTALKPLLPILVGAILCLGSIAYLSARLFGRHIESRTYEAFLIYNKKKKEIIPVQRYAFLEGIHQYMVGAFAENPALKTLWENEPLSDFSVSDIVKDKHKRPRSAQLLSEAVEYFILDELSTHLTDYFNVESFRKENLKEYRREDIPEVLLSNRFLELFSRPMEERSAFVSKTLKKKGYVEIRRVDEPSEDIKEQGEIVRAYEPSGAIYDRFDLVLPTRSAVRRPEDNKVEIETKKLKMTISIRFEGFTTVLPRGFERYYLGIRNWQDNAEYKLRIDIQVLMKLGALFSRAGWEYYYWVDSFLDKIEDRVSEDAFFKRLDWESVLTLLQCLKRIERNDAKKEEEW